MNTRWILDDLQYGLPLKMVILQFATSTNYGIPPSSNALTQVDVFVNVDGDIQKCQPSVGEPQGTQLGWGNHWEIGGGTHM